MCQQKINQLMKDLERALKGHAICIGHNLDRIDAQLTNYMNSYPERDKLKILFLRESEGVYQFG